MRPCKAVLQRNFWEPFQLPIIAVGVPGCLNWLSKAIIIFPFITWLISKLIKNEISFCKKLRKLFGPAFFCSWSTVLKNSVWLLLATLLKSKQSWCAMGFQNFPFLNYQWYVFQINNPFLNLVDFLLLFLTKPNHLKQLGYISMIKINTIYWMGYSM